MIAAALEGSLYVPHIVFVVFDPASGEKGNASKTPQLEEYTVRRARRSLGSLLSLVPLRHGPGGAAGALHSAAVDVGLVAVALRVLARHEVGAQAGHHCVRVVVVPVHTAAPFRYSV